ncbi:MAG TPA: hypothetical protein VLG50_03460 [Candidatus Saccharimonadales bacterium]|nr:hypothetical protein [Candidatus Saccharimonadales bacterium]
MKKLFFYVTVFSFAYCLQASSIIHKSLGHLDNPASKAVVRQSIVAIRNVDLAQKTVEYKNWLKNGNHTSHKNYDEKKSLFDFITPETEQKGLPVDGYIALDIATSSDTTQTKDLNSVKRFVNNFVLQSSIQEFAHCKLPAWIESEYTLLQYLLLDDGWLNDADQQKYDFLDQRIGLAVFDYIVQNWYKQHLGKRKYLYGKNGKNHSAVIETEQKKIDDDILSQASIFFRYIKNIMHKPIDEETEFLIVCAEDLFPDLQGQQIRTILNNSKINHPHAKIIVVFGHESTMRYCGPRNEHLIIIGPYVMKIYYISVLDYLLKTLDLSSLGQVQSVADHALAHCLVLKEINLSSWSEIKDVGIDFLKGCESLEKIILHRNLYILLLQKDVHFFEQFPKLKPENIIIVD